MLSQFGVVVHAARTSAAPTTIPPTATPTATLAALNNNPVFILLTPLFLTLLALLLLLFIRHPLFSLSITLSPFLIVTLSSFFIVILFFFRHPE